MKKRIYTYIIVFLVCMIVILKNLKICCYIQYYLMLHQLNSLNLPIAEWSPIKLAKPGWYKLKLDQKEIKVFIAPNFSCYRVFINKALQKEPSARIIFYDSWIDYGKLTPSQQEIIANEIIQYLKQEKLSAAEKYLAISILKRLNKSTAAKYFIKLVK
jgi:hypothetical protein